MAQKQSTTNRGTIIQINEEQVKNHLGEIVRGTVQETLNALLDEEASRLCNARRYERTEGRKDTRAGHYTRTLQTKAGEVDIRMPKLRALPFETAIIERYRRRESSVEEALVEMYLAGVSVRRVEDITEALWGSKVSPGTISHLNAEEELGRRGKERIGIGGDRGQSGRLPGDPGSGRGGKGRQGELDLLFTVSEGKRAQRGGAVHLR